MPSQSDPEKLLARAALKLGVTLGERMSGGHASAVYRCETREGVGAVLKLPPTRAAAVLEVTALTTWEASGQAVGLLASDLETGALLLQLLTPGTALGHGDRPGAVTAAARALKDLHVKPPPHTFPDLMTRYQSLERKALRDASYETGALGRPTPPGVALLPRARAAAERLSGSAGDAVLLHGDFIDKNLLLHQEHYVAIDPWPMTGDPGSDIGFFAAYHPPASDALALASDLARTAGHPAERARRWTAVWLCHQACESWRADHQELHSLMSDSAVLGLLPP